ncbi:MAG: phosphoribosylamine--glycine ligase [Bacteroidales bacterium]|jgi:phosphoribosylamine--glycine ligase|nr:phosphoribosylamine--glycine ligase [Bacteroidales bacterium]MCK9499318.1 phosphoribosylamine--glycine ligase [Bacteroidales bacterium]MDY0313821.1 phosphoribosylamine--glycine ligase [Bacteroidales bacterium]NLB87367.1 phosphoribosylamine--glycine ligase [Bacteroidales bacterium]
MNILILGSGGREHALTYKILESKLVKKVFVAPGNAGTEQIAENVNLNPLNFEEISDFILNNKINLLVVGSEDPLVAGITNYLKNIENHKNLMIIGPDKEGAMLEGSKDFAKSFMQKYNIPTAAYFSANKSNINQAIDFLKNLKPPYVLKADGLAAGKGVLIINELSQAIRELENMLNGKFGKASSKVVIEEFLDGIECSVFVITDGESYVILPEAKDYKRIGEADTGLNTGGMGAVSPVPFYTKEFAEKVENQIIIPSINGIKNENFDYCGFIFFGLMNVGGNPYVIEYNVRLGDPETEAILPRINSDFLELLVQAANKNLSKVKIEISEQTAVCVILVSGGYPEDYEKGKIISGIDKIDESIVFHAGTKLNQREILSNGGRVLAVTSLANNIQEAVNKSYKSIAKIKFDKMNFRKDIGKDLQ